MWALVGSHPQNYMRSGSAPLGWGMAADYKNVPIPICVTVTMPKLVVLHQRCGDRWEVAQKMMCWGYGAPPFGTGWLSDYKSTCPLGFHAEFDCCW